jgi:hypothetical protein
MYMSWNELLNILRFIRTPVKGVQFRLFYVIKQKYSELLLERT